MMGAALPREGVPLKYPTRATPFDGGKGRGSFGSTKPARSVFRDGTVSTMPSAETKSSLEKGGNATSPLLSSQWVACAVPPVTQDRAHDLADFRDGGANIGMELPRLPSAVGTKHQSQQVHECSRPICYC
jgi:hypothetical protein